MLYYLPAALFGILLNLLSLKCICECRCALIIIFTSRGQKCFTLCVTARLESEVSGVYLQSPCCGGVGGEKDSGYDSLRRKMSVLDRLTQTHPVWLLLAVSEEEASHILLKQPPGVRGYHPGIHILTMNIIDNCIIFHDL